MAKLFNNIRMHRARLKLSQQELANQVGVRRETINSLEQGKYNPSLILAMNIADVLQVELHELFVLSKEETQ